jgi:ferritin
MSLVWFLNSKIISSTDSSFQNFQSAMNELTSAINNHLACEFQASHTYLAMSIWLREKNLIGFSTYMETKSNEERTHASRMIAFLVDNDEKVELPSINAPDYEWDSLEALFSNVYSMEKEVTASINHIYGIAERINNRPATVMLDWFIDEQVKEESEARFICKRLKLINTNTAAMLLLDQQFFDGTFLANMQSAAGFNPGAAA